MSARMDRQVWLQRVAEAVLAETGRTRQPLHTYRTNEPYEPHSDPCQLSCCRTRLDAAKARGDW